MARRLRDRWRYLPRGAQLAQNAAHVDPVRHSLTT
jgi:hypothetical protein